MSNSRVVARTPRAPMPNSQVIARTPRASSSNSQAVARTPRAISSNSQVVARTPRASSSNSQVVARTPRAISSDSQVVARMPYKKHPAKQFLLIWMLLSFQFSKLILKTNSYKPYNFEIINFLYSRNFSVRLKSSALGFGSSITISSVILPGLPLKI